MTSAVSTQFLDSFFPILQPHRRGLLWVALVLLNRPIRLAFAGTCSLRNTSQGQGALKKLHKGYEPVTLAGPTQA